MNSAQTQRSARIAWISGLKGLACYGVFVHHFLLMLVPESYYGGPRGGISWLLSSSPLGVVINGNFLVFLFTMISAYLIANSVLHCGESDFRSKIGTTCVKRYFRLMLPILAYGCIRQVLVTLIYRFVGPINVAPYPSWWYILRHAVYDTFVQPDSSITGPLWMLSDLFIGSYIVLFLSLPDRKKAEKWLLFVYLAAFAVTEVRLSNFYLSASVGGILLVDLQRFWDRLLDNRKLRWLPKVCILIGLFLGGVPTHPVPERAACYSFATENPFLYHCRGAFFLLLGLLGEYFISQKEHGHKRILVRFLETKPLQYLGTISFSIFIIHEFILTACQPPLKEYLMTQLSFSLKSAGLLSLILLSASTLLVSCLFYYGIERNTDRLCRKIQL